MFGEYVGEAKWGQSFVQEGGGGSMKEPAASSVWRRLT